MNILITLLILGIIIFIHELGHFSAAKFFNIPVTEFSIGMGPEIFSHKGKNTLYKLRGIPIGGFVNIAGMDPEEKVENGFNTQSKIKRFIVLIAGVFMNFVLTFLIIFSMLMIVGENIPVDKPVVGKIVKDSPADKILKVDDEILMINSQEIKNWTDISRVIDNNENEKITLKIRREDKILKLDSELEYDITRESYYLGIYQKFIHKEYNLIQGIEKSVENFKQMFFLIFKGLKMLVSGEVSKNEVSGPVGTVKIVGEFAKYGVFSLLYLTAILSINVGIFNLLPFPALDGGRIIFVILEIFNIKINKKTEENVHRFGIVVLLLLMLIITANDIQNLF